MDSKARKKRIASLEAELAALYEEEVRDLGVRPWNAPAEYSPGDPFLVSDESELDLIGTPPLVRQILDALPVQVFVKRSAIEGTRGRKYNYLNYSARAPLQWTEADVKVKYDSEAFPADEAGVSLYKKMQQQESETLDTRKSRLMPLDWTPRPGGWHHNATREIPILDAKGDPVGFCAIAEDIVFRQMPHAWANLQRVYNHEYRNLLSGLNWRFTRVAENLERLLRSGHDGQIPDLAEAKTHLDLIAKTLSVARNASDVITQGLRGAIDETDDAVPSLTVTERVKNVYVNGPHDFAVDFGDDAAQQTEVPHPHVLAALLVILCNNALKYSVKDVPLIERAGAIKSCRLSCSLVNTDIVWRISNPCSELTGSLDLRWTGYQDLFADKDRGFDSQLLQAIAQLAFPRYALSAENMIHFPNSPKDGWVHVEVRCPKKRT